MARSTKAFIWPPTVILIVDNSCLKSPTSGAFKTLKPVIEFAQRLIQKIVIHFRYIYFARSWNVFFFSSKQHQSVFCEVEKCLFLYMKCSQNQWWYCTIFLFRWCFQGEHKGVRAHTVQMLLLQIITRDPSPWIMCERQSTSGCLS